MILFAFGTYVVACYWLQYDDKEVEGHELMYHLEQSSQLTFEMTECFLAVSFGINLFFRAMHPAEMRELVPVSARNSSLIRASYTKPASPSLCAQFLKFLTSYIFVDSLAFASFLCTAQMAPLSFTRVHYYNGYLISGIFRAFRLRRTLKALDIHEQRQDIVARFRRKKYVLLSWRQAGTIVLGTKVILYLTAWCCLIMFAEFPCPGVAASPDNCNPDFTKFHQTFYFICITLATVGFGDMVPETTFGSFCAFCLIITGAAAVPYFVREFHLLWSREQEGLELLREAEADLHEAKARLQGLVQRRLALRELRGTRGKHPLTCS